MRGYHGVAGIVALSAACGGVTHVVPTGPDTYTVAHHGVMGHSSGAAQKAKAFEEAGAFCRSQGKTLFATNSNETESRWGQVPSGEVDFKCLSPGVDSQLPAKTP